ncbi:alpha/beta hydrolase [Actinomadura rifamycini]|uniref:alpha/beta hydrolase n=1 Tax=Actinomadura rifamycini TaxID=31962 RepID=UPI0004046F72|nr:alpha/beta fold hydrolase [Actinomadura rifamycini]
MTLGERARTDARTDTRDGGARTGGTVEARVADVGGVPMSARIAAVPHPRATVLALHGGAVSTAYFDAPGHPRLSLLRTGAALGFTVIALDRPGYGASAPHAERVAPAERRVDLAYRAVDALLGPRPRGAGLFVLAHSVGCELAVRMAACERGDALLGLELSGTGVRHHDRAAGILAPGDGKRLPAARSIRGLIWGPDELYPPDVIGHPDLQARSPAYEGDVVPPWPSRLPGLAARVRVPVRYTLAEHETVWRPGRAALDEVAGLFGGSPRVAVDEQAGGGHNLSLGYAAAAYHWKALAYAEECASARTRLRADADDGPGTGTGADTDPTGE